MQRRSGKAMRGLYLIDPAKGLNMKVVPSLLVLAIAGGVVPAAEGGQKTRPAPWRARGAWRKRCEFEES